MRRKERRDEGTEREAEGHAVGGDAVDGMRVYVERLTVVVLRLGRVRAEVLFDRDGRLAG